MNGSETGRNPRHASINKILSEALKTTGYPNILEPPEMNRTDGKRTGGVTIYPSSRGKALLWDVTIRDTIINLFVTSLSKHHNRFSRRHSQMLRMLNIC